ncbi:queuosine precursor transporter [Arthrobacter sp. zg-Y820]|uniref:queuosine precursor transporter n=1 Tax=unclassified Arthrobacter TaxID=235627 RepID=UPI001E52E690|nr:MULTISPECIES: queuosine precursor transporter [unclassified Arthrobacter]MCC9198307.1 queuosine precursor transporter [Arthrobacter sp. zg-Y820]MDK1281177.1 queuosine precursor transporter [Arthrobacter sp. zg.Y820]WIB09768.1 queuosine precursor transporter [Arthrobacter sp. zg-Y820]
MHTPTGIAPASAPSFAARGSSHYDIILTLMCVVIVISNIGATKGVVLGPIFGDFSIVTDGGFFLFPLAYILGDVISEVYGFKAARRAIFTGFAVAAVAAISFAVIIALPGFDDEYGQAKQAALELALGPVWQIVAASLLGFLAGQTLNSWVLVKMKERFRERALIGRLMASTGVGEFADTLIFCAVAAPVIGITDAAGFINYVLFGFVYKTLIEFLFVPVTAVVIKAIKKREPSYAAIYAAAPAG